MEIAGGIPVLPVHGQPPSVQPWRFPAQPISRPPRLELTSESGVESGSGTDAGCRTIQVNPDAVEVNVSRNATDPDINLCMDFRKNCFVDAAAPVAGLS